MKHIINIKFLTLFFLIILCINKFSSAQLNFKNGFELSYTNLSALDLTLIYSHHIKDNKYLEISNSFVFPKSKYQSNPVFLWVTIKDPLKFYNIYKFRVGVKYLKSDNKFICPMLVFNAGWFNDCYIRKYIDDYGSDAYDEDYRLSRIRYDIGAIVKFGNISTKNNFISSVYWGLGFKVKFYDDYILGKRTFYGSIDYGDNPVHEQYVKLAPTAHIGVTIGYIK